MVLYDEGWTRKRLSSQLIWFGVWAGVTLIALFLKPDPQHHGTHQQLGLPPCPSVLLFHRPCPGCGLTTSWTAFVHGEFKESFEAHPLGPLLYIAFTAASWLGAYGWLKGLRLRTDSKPSNLALVTLLSSVLVFGFVRFATTRYDEPYPAMADIWSLPRTGEQRGGPASVPKQNPPSHLARAGQIQ